MAEVRFFFVEVVVVKLCTGPAAGEIGGNGAPSKEIVSAYQHVHRKISRGQPSFV